MLTFLDTLPEPYRTQSWDIFRQNSSAVARYVAASDYYTATMRARLGLTEQQIVCVRNGLDLTEYKRQPHTPEVPVIGYLARQIASDHYEARGGAAAVGAAAQGAAAEALGLPLLGGAERRSPAAPGEAR